MSSLQQRDRYRVPRQEWIRTTSTTTRTDHGLNFRNPDSMSDLPQLLQEIQEKLIKGTVECMICYDIVRRSAHVWSCSSCYSIFHLNCVKKWACAPTFFYHSSVDRNMRGGWRCPGCQSVQVTASKEIRYLCFCGKRPCPPTDLYLTPHSCGESCGKPLERDRHGGGDVCPHVCVLQCHPGPCPPCKAFAPPRLCPCGKKNIVTRCFDRQSLLTCGQQCEKLLECGRHKCERICHLGPCDPCGVPIHASCFCGKKNSQTILCGDMDFKGEINAKKGGLFSCGSTCGKKLGCGNHICLEICHPGSCAAECDLSPTHVKTCCCGKTRLEEDERQSCLDPIPTCSQLCGKSLPCGMHHCKNTCHVGDCSHCFVLVSQKCQCGSASKIVECYKTTIGNEKFTCEKPCGKKKNCGKHRCSERCCPLSNPNHITNTDWDPHLCSISCGKQLRCGQHTCESLCHSGHCPPCLHTVFTDLTCACGNTSIPPPLPCGTEPPSCQLPCSVPQPCGHPASHSCHYGNCPPCSALVAKECVGEHVVVRNVRCGSKDIRCNNLCGKTRQCGLHSCGRTCHIPPCDAQPAMQGIQTSCGQTCGAPRRDCKHTCTASCHPSSPCPDKTCEFPVTISCSCGRITTDVPCGAGGCNANFNATALYETSITQKFHVPLQPLDANDPKVPLGQRKLMCNDDCAKLERRRILANAFDITVPNLNSLCFGENSTSSEFLADLFRRDTKWVLSVEERCKCLVLSKSKGTTRGIKAHVFCPMLKDKRDALKVIAERWKLVVNTAGREPKRFMVVHVTQKSRAPKRLLGVKDPTSVHAPHPPTFDPLVDMDPRFVVSFSDLPRDGDISALVLRFGGECELFWLDDKNALAVFHDPARATTAMRMLDHGSSYYGAAVVVPNIGPSVVSIGTTSQKGFGTMKEGGSSEKLKGNQWKKFVIQGSGWREDSWCDNEWATSFANTQSFILKKEAPISASSNPWSVLDQESSSSSSIVAVKAEVPRKHIESSVVTNLKHQHEKDLNILKDFDVVDDWEKACE